MSNAFNTLETARAEINRLVESLQGLAIRNPSAMQDVKAILGFTHAFLWDNRTPNCAACGRPETDNVHKGRKTIQCLTHTR